MIPHLIVGLGNPSPVYAKTRHNVGFMVIDELCGRLGKGMQGGKGDYEFFSSRMENEEIILAKPLTYMNQSGLAVAEMLHQFEVPLKNLLIVVDDFALPLGTLRLRGKGTDGGHNGLRSVIYHLATGEFSRLRCGIATPEMPLNEGKADFVLSPFPRTEWETIRNMVKRAADAVQSFVRAGLQQTMNIYNT